jgi:hypothetical protein
VTYTETNGHKYWPTGKLYRPKAIKSDGRKNRRTKNKITSIKDALVEILEGDHPQTVRQVYYQMIVRGRMGKPRKNTKTPSVACSVNCARTV